MVGLMVASSVVQMAGNLAVMKEQQMAEHLVASWAMTMVDQLVEKMADRSVPWLELS
jgi:hypothetical protein